MNLSFVQLLFKNIAKKRDMNDSCNNQNLILFHGNISHHSFVFSSPSDFHPPFISFSLSSISHSFSFHLLCMSPWPITVHLSTFFPSQITSSFSWFWNGHGLMRQWREMREKKKCWIATHDLLSKKHSTHLSRQGPSCVLLSSPFLCLKILLWSEPNLLSFFLASSLMVWRVTADWPSLFFFLFLFSLSFFWNE